MRAFRAETSGGSPIPAGLASSKNDGANSGRWTIPAPSTEMFDSDSLIPRSRRYIPMAVVSDLERRFLPDLTSTAHTLPFRLTTKSSSSVLSRLWK